MVKGYFVKEYIVYILARTASFIISRLPLSFALWIGEIIGLCMYHLHPKRKRIAYANLKAAFSKEKTPHELKNILKSTYRNYGQTIIETLRIPRVDYKYLEKFVSIEHQERVAQAKARGKGVIFLTSHFGSWEILSLKSAQIGHPIHVLARPQRHQRLNDLLNKYREKLGCKVINRGMSARAIIKALKENKIIGILADQDVGKAGFYIDLFGRPASHAIGAARLARDTGAVILPAFIVREKGPVHTVKLDDIIEVPKTHDKDRDVENALKVHARVLESYVTQYTDQWMWVYTRWKSTPLRKIVILNDGRAGHLNQSLAVLETIKKCRRDAGFTDENTHVKIIDVKYKNRSGRAILTFLALFVSHRRQGSMQHLKFALREDSYKELMKSYADIIISCGSSSVPVNIYLKRENNAKNVVIMKPGILGLRNFNIVIMPKHDRPRERQNVIITEGSPNLINRESMKDGLDRIRGRIKQDKKKRLGLLLGGNNPEYELTASLANKLIDGIEKSLKEFDMELLVTTSRRTPKEVEELLKKRIGINPRCKLLIIANEDNIQNAVGGILELSDAVLVSGESVSMVSEAASSGKNTISFDLIKKKGSTKHDRALKELNKENYILRTTVDNIYETIAGLLLRKNPLRKLNDAEKMYKKLYRII